MKFTLWSQEWIMFCQLVLFQMRNKKMDSVWKLLHKYVRPQVVW